MKMMIASDIHGSAKYCAMLLEAYAREGAGRLLLLGDLLYHGPRNDLPDAYAPKQVIALLSQRKEETFGVRGNCEAEVDQMVLPFPVMADYCLLPLGERIIFATHGHLFHKGNLPPMKRGDILLHGHTHISGREEENGVLILNPGSVSIPKGGTPRGYLMWEGSMFTWKTLERGEVLDTLDVEN